jgi:cytochrome c oxidase subunit 4
MDHGNPEAIKKQLKSMIFVFIALLALTMVTVAASYLHLSHVMTIVVALFIATVKGSLVCLYFMHLISERALIYWVLLFCAVFFAVMMGLVMFTNSDPIVLG